MDTLVRDLMTLGLREYEARIYAALTGIGEGTARQIHEISGVPRPRVYDVVEGLAEQGFVEVRRGKPNLYVPVEPVVLVNRLKSRIETAATDSVKVLDSLSLDIRKKTSPILYIQGEWSIRRHLKSLAEKVSSELLIVCMDYDSIGEFTSIISEASEKHPVSILLPNGKKGITRMLGSASLHIPTEFCEFFQENIYRQLFAGPVRRDRSEFILEYIFVADENGCMIIYSQNSTRMAVVITLPFITCVLKQFLKKMITHASEIEIRNPGKTQN